MGNSRVIVIEDNRDLAFIFAESARLASFQVDVVGDGAVALEHLQQMTPALIILDLHLPTISGLEVLHQIRADERLTCVPVIVTTADPILADIVRGQVSHVLLKPIDFTTLRQVVVRTLLTGGPAESAGRG